MGSSRDEINLCHIKEYILNREIPGDYLSDTDEKRISNRIKCLKRKAKSFTLDGDSMFYINKKGKRKKVLLNNSEIEVVLKEVHGDEHGGPHRGMKQVQQTISNRFYWLTVCKDVRDWIVSCPGCQKTPKSTAAVPEPHQIIVDEPLKVWGIDLLGPMPTTKQGNNYIVTCTDLFSRWTEAEAIKNSSPESVFMAIEKWYYRHGAPERIITAERKSFNNKSLNDLVFNKWHIKHVIAGSYPKTNGSLKRTLQKFANKEQNNWDEHLDKALWALRCSFNESTKVSPYLLMFGREPRFFSEIIDCEAEIVRSSNPEEDYLAQLRKRQAIVTNKINTKKEANK